MDDFFFLFPLSFSFPPPPYASLCAYLTAESWGAEGSVGWGRDERRDMKTIKKKPMTTSQTMMVGLFGRDEVVFGFFLAFRNSSLVFYFSFSNIKYWRIEIEK